ncbi:MAG: hypothetical protein JWO46_3130 [Nocardioidaceae bacterium]|nr:hypothetical protein [Nocardioidaceae bacterium]
MGPYGDAAYGRGMSNGSDETQPGEIPDEMLPDDVRPSEDNPLAEGPLDGEEEEGLSPPE